MIENDYNKKISEIPAIEGTEYLEGVSGGSEGKIVENREILRKFIEAPCLPACLALYDKNIRTHSSSANKQNIGNTGDIKIYYHSLDENNKQIANQLIDTGIAIFNSHINSWNPEESITISVPINREDTVGIVSDRFMQIVSQFQQQDVLYGRLTYKDILEEASANGISPEGIIEVFEYIYDEELDIYWLNQELYNKHKQYQDKLKEQVEDSERPDHVDT